MRSIDLLDFVLGDREAIQRLAANRASLFVGAIFVLATTVAREHDELDLTQALEPWFFGLLLSAAVAVVLHLIMRVVLRGRWSGQGRPDLGVMIAMVWLTAPVAWLYAVPVERWTPPVEAAKLNVAFLAVVATWRVVLMGRVLSVLTGCGGGVAASIVTAPSTALFGGALAAMPVQTLQIMGGGRLEAEEALPALVKTFGVPLLFWVSLLAWFGLLKLVIWRGDVPESVQAPRATGMHGLPLGALAASLALWGAVFAYSQPRVQAALRANAVLASGDLEASKRVLLAIPEGEWPPRIAPHPDSRERRALGELTRLLRAGLIDALPPQHWYRSRALDEMRRYRMFRWTTREGKEERALAEALVGSEAGRAWLRAHPGEPRYLGRWDRDVRKLIDPAASP